MTQTDIVKLHTANLRKLLDSIDLLASSNRISRTMESIEYLTKELEALRYHVWHSFHTSGRVQE